MTGPRQTDTDAAITGSDFLQLVRPATPRGGLTSWLVDTLRAAVMDGRLPTGTRLPSSRELAVDLRLSRGVVVDAYQRLREEGLLAGRAGAGTVVTSLWPVGPEPAAAPVGRRRPVRAPGADAPPVRLPQSPERTTDIEFDLSPGVPDLSAFPRAAWLRAEREVLSRASAADLGYGDPRGHPRLRRELSAWLARTRGLRAEPEGVIVVAGVAQALAILTQTLCAQRRGTIAVEDPGSRGARDELAHWGAATIAVPVDEQGIVVEELAATPADAALLTPAHQFPTGVVLSAARRRALLAWAGEGRLVIEDDYDAEQRYDRPPVAALQASAPDRVAHTGSTSKSLAPGLRLGWLVPPPELLDQLVDAKHASDISTPAIPQLVLAELLAGGRYDQHLRRLRNRQRRRRDALVSALREHLPELTVSGVAAGLHVLVTVPAAEGAVDDAELAARLRAAGVLLQPLSLHRVTPGAPGLVLGYALHPPDRLADAVKRMASVLS
jgi:GntR family transcriptional regulator / MocR family aminotransferase